MRGEIAGRYVLRRELGADGRVHEALDRLTGRRVAVMTWPLPAQGEGGAAAVAARMRQGAKAAARLNHPNIVAVLDHGEDAGQGWVVTEPLEGETLDRLLQRRRIPPPQAVAIVLQLLDALAYAHAMGIAHRALAPDKVLIGPDLQRASIMGFGLRPDVPLPGQAAPTEAGMRDALPERRRGERLDHRADIWTTGAMLRRMLAAGDSARSAASTAAIRLPPAVRAFEAVLAKALADYPEDRFASASEFASALREAAQVAFPDLPHAAIELPASVVAEHAPAAPAAASFDAFERPPLSVPRPARTAVRRRGAWWRTVAVLVTTALTAGGIALVASHRDLLDTAQRQAMPPPVATPADTGAAEAPHAEAASDTAPPRALEAAAAAVPASVSCGLVATRVTDGMLDITGVVKREEQAALERALVRRAVPAAATRLSVATFDGPFCPVLEAARAFVAAPGEGPRVRLLSPVPLPVGRHLRFSVEAPAEWPVVHLSVSYLTIEGYVGHLVGVEMAAGTTVTFADPSWQAAQPAGTDLMLVVATDRPLFPRRAERARVSRIPDFAAALATMLRAGRESGARIAIRAVAVPIVAP